MPTNTSSDNVIKVLVGGGLVLLLILVLLSSCDVMQNEAAPGLRQQVQALMKEDVGLGFSQAYQSRELMFPRDYGPHHQYKHESWFFGGNLHTKGYRDFAYTLTLYRLGLTPERDLITGKDFTIGAGKKKSIQSSPWRANSVYMAHFTLLDIKNNKFYVAERLSRPSLKLAGAMVEVRERGAEDSHQLKMWLHNWKLESLGDKIFPLTITAKDKNISIDLTVRKTKPNTPHGDKGLQRNSTSPGDALYHYSVPRLTTSGIVYIDGQDYRINGDSWFDQQWTSVSLDKTHLQQDVFRLQLEDRRELLLYQVRLGEQSNAGFTRGAIVNHQGIYKPLLSEDFALEILDYWVSPQTGIKYPNAWHLAVPSETLELEILPRLDMQEVDGAMRYWLGAVKITGQQLNAPGKTIRGTGLVELSGYTETR